MPLFRRNGSDGLLRIPLRASKVPHQSRHNLVAAFFMATPRTTLRPKDQKANQQIIEARLCGLYAYPRNKRPQVAENRRFRYDAEIAGDLPPK